MTVSARLRPHLVRMATILLSLLTLYVMLAFVNQILPLVAPPQLLGRANAIGMPDGLQVPHERLGYAFPPHWHGRFLGQPEQQVTIDTNALGWRDEEFGPPGAGTPRLLVIGDSITMGVGVEAEQRYSERLEELLPGSEVDNCAASGYELNQLVTLVELMLPQTRPDLVIYGLCLNDIRVADLALAAAVEERTARIRIRAAFELRNFGRFIQNVRLLRNEAKLSRTGSRPAESRVIRRWEDPTQRDAFAQRLEELQRICDAADARLLVVIFPYTFQFDKPATDPIRDPQRHLTAILEARQIAYLDLFETLQAATTRVFLPADNCHPNATGNQIVAEAIAARLRTLLPTDTTPKDEGNDDLAGRGRHARGRDR